MDAKRAHYVESKTGSQLNLPYDYLIAATGIRREFPIVPNALNKQQYLKDANTCINDLVHAKKIVVVGGGAVGVEFAAEIKHQFPTKHVILIHSRDQLLSSEPLPIGFKTKTHELITSLGVQVILNRRLVSYERFEARGDNILLRLSDDEVIACGKIISTTSGYRARTEFLPKDVVDDKGFVKVKKTLQFAGAHPNSSSHCAIGDIVAWTGIKRVGNAFIMGQFAATNVLKLILYAQSCSRGDQTTNVMQENDAKLIECPDMEPMMALSIGDTAVVYKAVFGLQWGSEMKEQVVGRGLGIDVCSAYLRLKR